MEKTIDQVQEASSSALDVAQQIFDVVGRVLKPAIDAGLPIAQKAGEEALKVASPAISEASKKAQEAIQGTGLDTEPVLSAAKVSSLTLFFQFLNVECKANGCILIMFEKF